MINTFLMDYVAKEKNSAHIVEVARTDTTNPYLVSCLGSNRTKNKPYLWLPVSFKGSIIRAAIRTGSSEEYLSLILDMLISQSDLFGTCYSSLEQAKAQVINPSKYVLYSKREEYPWLPKGYSVYGPAEKANIGFFFQFPEDRFAMVCYNLQTLYFIQELGLGYVMDKGSDEHR